ncbi:hypothetical protein [Knoellia koreensis]|uniref:Integral membrane protein n=1 Tax=Knoellia koreensis TaxID=2730921 RepID=A0A849H912_9MICO|nr:hypothetical protein [Knoellia sp. DB2414S]NNM46350.1 hypothetical protein [Knoellia sp. DB2414S]
MRRANRITPDAQALLARYRQDLVAVSAFLVLRAVGAVLMATAGRGQVALETSSPAYHVFAPTPAAPDYLGLLGNWDGQWYQQIATDGYPGVTTTGQSSWAFYPLFPFLCRLLMTLGFGFGAAATMVNLVAGVVSTVLLNRMVRERGGPFTAIAVVVAFNSFVAAPILQAGYAESLTIALVLACLRLLQCGRFALLCLSLALLGLARPVSLPMAVVVSVWVAGARWSRADRAAGPRTPPSAWAATGVAWLAVGLWPGVVGLANGSLGSYLQTQSAWPVNGGLDAGWANWVYQGARSTPVTVLCGLILVGTAVTVAARPAARAWGGELRAWAVAYPLFILLATRPGPSVARLLLPAVVIFWPWPTPDSQVRVSMRLWMPLGAVAAVGIVCQWWWVGHVFTISTSPEVQPYP